MFERPHKTADVWNINQNLMGLKLQSQLELWHSIKQLQVNIQHKFLISH